LNYSLEEGWELSDTYGGENNKEEGHEFLACSGAAHQLKKGWEFKLILDGPPFQDGHKESDVVVTTGAGKLLGFNRSANSDVEDNKT
jgi:hypothetical protein